MVNRDIPEFAPLVERLLMEPLLRKAVSFTYKTLINNAPDGLVNLRLKSERDIQIMEDTDWEVALMHLERWPLGLGCG